MVLKEVDMSVLEPQILAKIRENNIAYIRDDGKIATFNLQDEFVDELSTMFRSSLKSFGGKYYGEIIDIVYEDENSVKAAIREMNSGANNGRANGGASSTENEAGQNLTSLLQRALASGVSDIHMVNDKNTALSYVSFRVDGDLEPVMDQSFDWAHQILSYTAMNLGNKQAYNIDDRDNFQFQLPISESKNVNGKIVQVERMTNWRYSQVPASRGNKVTVRAVDSAGGKVPSLDELGLGKGQRNHLLDIAYSGQGALIVSGPTGSGKTTTINSLLSYVPETKMIHTIEDPPEWSLTRRNEAQTPVDDAFINPKTKEKTKTFHVYGKDMLRNDTDVVYTGEVRDKDTASVFLRMSETGQLAITTLHSNNSISIISALVQQMGVNANQLAAPGTLKALTHQRLVRKVCPKCSLTYEQAKASSDELILERVKLVDKLLLDKAQNTRFKVDVTNDKSKPKCKHCDGKGQKGRTSVFEIIVIDSKSREFIQKMDLNGWLEYLKTIGWKSFQDHAIEKIRLGECDIDSVMQKVDGLFPINSNAIYEDLF